MSEEEDEIAELGILVTGMSDAQLNEQPFGVIRLDERGRVVTFNSYEESLSRLRREDVIGKSFFFEVAPCTRVRSFYQRYVDGVARGHLRARFGFVFPFRHGDREVEVTMFLQPGDRHVWIVVRGG